jgi:HEPN domain-containing protein
MTCFLPQQSIEKALRAITMGFLGEHPPHICDLIVLYAGVKSVLDLIPSKVVSEN